MSGALARINLNSRNPGKTGKIGSENENGTGLYR